MGRKNIAIITGASSGFGKEFVRLLSRDKRQVGVPNQLF